MPWTALQFRRDAEVDAKGRPALGREFKRATFTYVKPLSDPVGGTKQVGGRHPSKMVEPDPGRRCARRGRAPDLRHVPDDGARLAALRPPAAIGHRREHQRPRFHALQRRDFRQAARARRLSRLAPGRPDALEQPRLERRHPRLQLPSAALSDHARELPVDSPRHPQARQARHQGHRRSELRLRPPARRDPAHVQSLAMSPWSTGRPCTAPSQTHRRICAFP